MAPRYSRHFRADPEGTAFELQTQACLGFGLLLQEVGVARRELRERASESVRLHVVLEAGELRMWRADLLPVGPLAPVVTARVDNAVVRWTFRDATHNECVEWIPHAVVAGDLQQPVRELVSRWLDLLAQATQGQA